MNVWATERQIDAHRDLDLLDTASLVELINDEDAKVAPAVRGAAPALAAAIDAIAARLQAGGRLVYVGAGTSGRLAATDAGECPATFGVPTELVVALVAGGPDAPEAADDDAGLGAADVAAAEISARDAVVLLSASGTTPYVVGAARAALAAGALVVAVVCARDSALGSLAEHEVVVEVGPEVLAGSTRLKAGTAQKLVLNTISTAAMIRLGRTYGNLMVGVVAANEKLRGRSRRTVALAAEVSDAAAADALAAAGGDARVAIVSLRLGIPPDAARERLEAAGGVVRRALEGR